VPGGDVEQFFHGLRLVTAKLLDQGSVVCAGPERQDDVSVTELGEFVTLLGETPDVLLQGFPWLLLTTLQISVIAGPHVCALEVAGENLLEILPTIDRVSGQVIDLVSYPIPR
jgi:hypothetical protein